MLSCKVKLHNFNDFKKFKKIVNECGGSINVDKKTLNYLNSYIKNKKRKSKRMRQQNDDFIIKDKEILFNNCLKPGVNNKFEIDQFKILEFKIKKNKAKDFFKNFPEAKHGKKNIQRPLLRSIINAFKRGDSSTKSLKFPPEFVYDKYDIIYKQITNKQIVLPKYPIYIISLGRFKTRPTSKLLDKSGIPYKICVEPHQYKDYLREIKDEHKIIKLPESYSKTKKQGSIPVRNFVLKHAYKNDKNGMHWLLDDNIVNFYRIIPEYFKSDYYKNVFIKNNGRIKVETGIGALFRSIEIITDQCKNVYQSGMHDQKFVIQASRPITFNTRIYSCTLMRNKIYRTKDKNKKLIRWRGKFNEDTDLSLRLLKIGKGTLLFNTYMMQKSTTTSGKNKVGTRGGNENIYINTEERKEFAESLRKQHPDIVTVKRKYNRWHHEVNYTGFKKNDIGYKLTANKVKFNDMNLKAFIIKKNTRKKSRKSKSKKQSFRKNNKKQQEEKLRAEAKERERQRIKKIKEKEARAIRRTNRERRKYRFSKRLQKNY